MHEYTYAVASLLTWASSTRVGYCCFFPWLRFDLIVLCIIAVKYREASNGDSSRVSTLPIASTEACLPFEWESASSPNISLGPYSPTCGGWGNRHDMGVRYFTSYLVYEVLVSTKHDAQRCTLDTNKHEYVVVFPLTCTKRSWTGSPLLEPSIA